jgi:hypothetical protein
MKLLDHVREAIRLETLQHSYRGILTLDGSRKPGVAALFPRPHLWVTLRVDLNVTADLGLTGQNVPLSSVLIGERILDGHAHITGKEFDTAGCA